MRTISYAVAVVSVGMIIAMSTVAFTTLLLESEKAGFQQAAAVLDTALVADYLTTHYASYCDGSMAYNNPDINPIYLVSSYDFDENGIPDYVDRINEVNNGDFDVHTGDVAIKLNNEEQTTIKGVTQSITYSATSTKCNWEEQKTGINEFRLAAAMSYINTFLTPTMATINAGIHTMKDVLSWIRSLYSSSAEPADLDVIPSIAGKPSIPFDITPAMTQNAEIHYMIPVIITEGDTTKSTATGASLHKLEITARVTFYDVREYFDKVAEAWEY